jgi:hypothetical protein
MSAPTDRPNDPNSVSFYAPRGGRPARLPPAEPMPALVPDDLESGESRGSLLSPSQPFEGDLAVQRLRARRSLDPDYTPGPPLPLRQRSSLAVLSRLVMVILAAAIVALIAIGQFPFPTFLRQLASDRELASSSSRPAAEPAKRADSEIPRLLVRASRGTSGQPAPLGVSLQGHADGARILITGLPAGTTLSTGTAVGADAWQVPATETVLSSTWIIPPKDFVGVVDLVAELHLTDATIAHRRPIHLEWVAAAPAAPAAPATPATAAAPATSPAAAATAPAAPNSAVAAAGPPQEAAAPVRAATPARQLDREEIDVLVKRGKDFLMSGDVAAARLVLQRAAESNDADAALTLAATYDPGMLRELKVYGVAADIALARAWYEKAAALGSTEAPHRLAVLASTTH